MEETLGKQAESKDLIDINLLETYHGLIEPRLAEMKSRMAAVEKKIDGIGKELNPVITIVMDDSYGDIATIGLNAEKNEDVEGDIVWTHNLPAGTAEIHEGVLTFLKHYEGSVTVTATADNASASKTFSVACTETVTDITYEVSNVRMSASEVEADATSITVYYTGKTISHYQLKEDSVVEQSLSKTVTFEENESEEDVTRSGSFKWNEKTVNWGVVQKGKVVVVDTVAGDIMCSDKTIVRPVYSEDGFSVESLDLGGKTPIGIVVIPSSHRDDGKTVIMSLPNMSLKTPSVGSLAKSGVDGDNYMMWGMDGVVAGVPKDDTLPVVNLSGTYDISHDGYVPSDWWNTSNKSADGIASYRDGVSPFCHSPYNADGSRNNVYFNGAFRYIYGKAYTQAIVDAATDSVGGDTVANTEASFPAANCCSRFFTDGTQAGDWYLPTIGELGYLYVRYKKIKASMDALEAMGKAAPLYNPTTKNSGAGREFLSSVGYSAGLTKGLFLDNGSMDTLDKNLTGTYFRVRAFCAITPN